MKIKYSAWGCVCLNSHLNCCLSYWAMRLTFYAISLFNGRIIFHHKNVPHCKKLEVLYLTLRKIHVIFKSNCIISPSHLLFMRVSISILTNHCFISILYSIYFGYLSYLFWMNIVLEEVTLLSFRGHLLDNPSNWNI